jgi:hypothetical protein
MCVGTAGHPYFFWWFSYGYQFSLGGLEKRDAKVEIDTTFTIPS